MTTFATIELEPCCADPKPALDSTQQSRWKFVVYCQTCDTEIVEVIRGGDDG